MKTDKQIVLELRTGMPIEEIVRDALEKHRGDPLFMLRAAVEMEVSDSTLYNWCRSLDIDVDDYRRGALTGVGESG